MASGARSRLRGMRMVWPPDRTRYPLCRVRRLHGQDEQRMGAAERATHPAMSTRQPAVNCPIYLVPHHQAASVFDLNAQADAQTAPRLAATEEHRVRRQCRGSAPARSNTNAAHQILECYHLGFLM